jgi:hypothetical protein
MLFAATDANLKTVGNGGSVGKADGSDVLFTAADGVTKLDHEMQQHNAAAGQVVAWVRIPSLSPAADTVVCVYYGNASAAEQQNKAGGVEQRVQGSVAFGGQRGECGGGGFERERIYGDQPGEHEREDDGGEDGRVAGV